MFFLLEDNRSRIFDTWLNSVVITTWVLSTRRAGNVSKQIWTLSVKVPLQLIWTPSLWHHLYMRSVFILITAAHFCVCQVSIMLAKTGLGSNAISAMEWSNHNKKQGNCILVWKTNMIGLQTHSERKQWLLTGLLYFKTKNNIISVCTHTTSHWFQVKPNTQVWIFKEHTCSYWSYWYFFPLLLFGIEVIQK